MNRTRNYYPVRAFIRHKARMQILASLGDPSLCPAMDQSLLDDLVNTVLQSDRGEPVYAPYPSREAAAKVEDSFAAELATTYEAIMQQRRDRHIQRLNDLLA